MTDSAAAVPRVLVFDLDDTLYPEREYTLSGLTAAGEVARQRFRLEGFGADAIALFNAGQRGTLFQQVLAQRAYEDTGGLIVETLLSAFRHHLPTIRMFPDVAEVLPRMRTVCRLALLTDGYLPPQRRKVEALGLQNMFDPIVYTEELGREHWKPSHRPFELVESLCGVRPERYVYIGDNPRKDFLAPRARGWDTVRVRRDDTEHSGVEGAQDDQAHVQVANFYELERWLTEEPTRRGVTSR
jgi:putative hydrolase of the HAD superfamily